MVKLYVEGGGETNDLKTACREAFTAFITNAGIEKRPRLVACGSRNDAYESYCTAIDNGEEAVLLVDSEEAVNPRCQNGAPETWLPWEHLRQRKGDGWEKPHGAPDTDCHLMVECMEAWFLADRETLKRFFGKDFHENSLPAKGATVEGVTKGAIYGSLSNATKKCQKGEYGKGAHSFHILKEISPAHVELASPWAKRFIAELKKKMDG